MKESSAALPLPPFDTVPLAAYQGPLPAYVRDRARTAALTDLLSRAVLESGVSAEFLLPLEKPPFTLVATQDAARQESGLIGLGVGRPHAASSPFAANPYDGRAFEVATTLTNNDEVTVTHLVSGLPGLDGTARQWGGWIYELGRFAAALRRATGMAPPGLALLGGVRFPRRGGVEALCRAWARVALGVEETASCFGLALDSVLMDFGDAFDFLTLTLLVEAKAVVKGKGGAIACCAPVPLLRRVLPGADLLSGGGCRYRLVSTERPAVVRLPKIDLSDGVMPRKLALRCRSREPGWSVIA